MGALVFGVAVNGSPATTRRPLSCLCEEVQADALFVCRWTILGKTPDKWVLFVALCSNPGTQQHALLYVAFCPVVLFHF